MKFAGLFPLAGVFAFGLMLRAQGPTNDALAAGQASAGQAAAEAAAEIQEQNDLNQAVADAGNSPVDYIRAVEGHLRKYPDTKERDAIERSLAKSAMDVNDAARIVLYGERVLARESQDDTQLLNRVIRALLDRGDSGSGQKALDLARRYEVDLQASRSQQPPGHLSTAIWSDMVDANLASAIALEARALGITGNPDEAVKTAERSWALYPSGEGARAAGFWLSKLDRNREAIEYYADAFTLEDPRTTAADRASDRDRLGELYRKVNQSEKGLGDLILAAYDRAAALRTARAANLKTRDPNASAADLLDFVLPAVDGSAPLRLSSLKGKTVVMDFWATWCIPCREQHAQIENVRKHFAGAPDVVFIPIDADDDPALAAPFAKEQAWESGYFEAGLGRHLKVSAIPTIFIVDPAGQLSSQITGFNAERFETLLTRRIEEARQSVSPR
jgi:thiol-disulfide isomerase/thioredoxin